MNSKGVLMVDLLSYSKRKGASFSTRSFFFYTTKLMNWFLSCENAQAWPVKVRAGIAAEHLRAISKFRFWNSYRWLSTSLRKELLNTGWTNSMVLQTTTSVFCLKRARQTSRKVDVASTGCVRSFVGCLGFQRLFAKTAVLLPFYAVS